MLNIESPLAQTSLLTQYWETIFITGLILTASAFSQDSNHAGLHLNNFWISFVDALFTYLSPDRDTNRFTDRIHFKKQLMKNKTQLVAIYISIVQDQLLHEY